MKLKNLLVALLAGMMVLTVAACGTDSQASVDIPETEVPQTAGFEREIANLPNPFQTFGTLDEAAAELDFSITLPETPEWATEVLYRVSDTDLLEIIYYGDDREYRIRKAAGDADISGDYSVYSEASDEAFGDLSLHVKGDDGMVGLITWTRGDYSYSAGFDGEISLKDAEKFIEAIE